MVINHKLAKVISAYGWGIFYTILKPKPSRGEWPFAPTAWAIRPYRLSGKFTILKYMK